MLLQLTIYIYLATVLLFGLRTYAEGRTSKVGSAAWRAAGLLLSLVWPAIVLCIAVEAMRQRRNPVLARSRQSTAVG
jgi:hypothetical protein